MTGEAVKAKARLRWGGELAPAPPAPSVASTPAVAPALNLPAAAAAEAAEDEAAAEDAEAELAAMQEDLEARLAEWQLRGAESGAADDAAGLRRHRSR